VAQTRRQALYFPEEMLKELRAESKRQDRSISWLIQQAWKIAYAELTKVPSTTDYLPPRDYASAAKSSGEGEKEET